MGKGIVKGINAALGMLLLTVLVGIIAVGGYVMWDTYRLEHTSDAAFYEVYKPDPEKVDGVIEFQKLQGKNPDVIGWITIYDTEVDYPLLQGEDNWEYLGKNALGEYSLTGSIFMDHRNSRNLTDFNTIIHGHNMTPKVMFGGIKDFKKKEHFDTHPYGEIYINGEKQGIELFAMIGSDAYDFDVFNPAITEKDKQQKYLDEIFESAVQKRDIGVTIEDRIVLLSTCSNVETNKRDILVGRFTDEVKGFSKEETASNGVNIQGVDAVKRVPLWMWIAAGATVLVIIALIYIRRKRKQD